MLTQTIAINMYRSVVHFTERLNLKMVSMNPSIALTLNVVFNIFSDILGEVISVLMLERIEEKG